MAHASEVARSTTVQDRLRFVEMTDNEVVLAAQTGDQEATEYLLHKYSGLVRAKLKSYFLLGAEKEDLHQVGMLGLWEAVMDFRQDKEVSFRCFAQMCVQRELITAIKAATRQRQLPLNSSLSLDACVYDDSPEKCLSDLLPCTRNRDPEALGTDTESATWLKRSIRQRLSAFEWRVFRAYLDGMSYSEVADRLACKVKSIDNALTRIRRKLAKVIMLPEPRGKNGDRRMVGAPMLVEREEMHQ